MLFASAPAATTFSFTRRIKTVSVPGCGTPTVGAQGHRYAPFDATIGFSRSSAQFAPQLAAPPGHKAALLGAVVFARPLMRTPRVDKP